MEKIKKYVKEGGKWLDNRRAKEKINIFGNIIKDNKGCRRI